MIQESHCNTEDTSKTKKKEYQLKVTTLAKNIIARVQRVNGILKNSYIPIISTVAASPAKRRNSGSFTSTSPTSGRRWSLTQRNSLPTFDVKVKTTFNTILLIFKEFEARKQILTKSEQLGSLLLRFCSLACLVLKDLYNHSLYQQLKYSLYDIEALLPSLCLLTKEIKSSDQYALQRILKELSEEVRKFIKLKQLNPIIELNILTRRISLAIERLVAQYARGNDTVKKLLGNK